MRRTILTSGLAVGGVRLAGMGLGVLVTIVLGRILGPAELGAYGYAVLVLTLLTVPVSYGWAIMLLRRVAAARHDGGWAEARGMARSGNVLAAVIALLVFAGAAMWSRSASPPLALSFGVSAGAVMGLVLFLDQLSALRLGTLRGLDHPVWGQVPEMVVRPALIVGAFSLFAILYRGQVSLQQALWALGIGSLVSYLVGRLVMLARQPAELAGARPLFRESEWARSAGLLAGNSGLVLLNANVDMLVLGSMAPMHDVGIYRVACQVALLSGFSYTALNMLAAPRFSALRAAGDWKSLQASAVFMARLAVAGAIPLPLLFFFFGEHILGGVFGRDFVPALGPMFVLFLGQAINASAGMSNALLMMTGRELPLLQITAAGAALNAVLSVLLIPRFGAMGAAFANLAGTTLWNGALWLQTLRLIQVDTSIFGKWGQARGAT